MYDPFANPVPPGQVQTMGQAQTPGNAQGGHQDVQGALAAFMARYQNQPWAQQWGAQFQPGANGAPGTPMTDWRGMKHGAKDAFRDARMDWRQDRPGAADGPAFGQQMQDWQADRPQWQGWGG